MRTVRRPRAANRERVTAAVAAPAAVLVASAAAVPPLLHRDGGRASYRATQSKFPKSLSTGNSLLNAFTLLKKRKKANKIKQKCKMFISKPRIESGRIETSLQSHVRAI